MVVVVGCWYLVEDSKLSNTNNPRPTPTTNTHDQQPKLISKSLKSLGWITLKIIPKTRQESLKHWEICYHVNQVAGCKL